MNRLLAMLIIFSIHFFCPCLSAVDVGEEMMIIDSGFADYDGKKVTLNGNVLVEHEIGKISACQVVLQPNENEKKLRFAFLQMFDNVKISLKDGGQLSCSRADLDYKALYGKFTGGPQHEYVIYTENCRNNAGKTASLVLKSREMSIKFSRNEATPHLSAISFIKGIQADSNVTILYSQDFIAAADQASYERILHNFSEENVSDSSLSGIITLNSKENGSLCQITNQNGDLIRSRKITIDTKKRHLHFDYPQGVIFTSTANKENSPIDFSCETLQWNEPQDILILRNNVVVNQKGMGKLTCSDEVQIFRQLVDGSKKLRTLNSFGPTVLEYSEGELGRSQVLSCQGKVILNHDSLQAYLESPKDHNGKVLPDKQAFLEDRLGEIHADTVTLNYQNTKQGISLSKVILSGNVRLLNRSAADEEDQGKFLQYALADRVEYFPLDHEMLLTAADNHRVLFFDKKNGLQISAPALQIKQDPKSSKDSIQGIGDVRFSFIEQEFEQLRQRFSMQKEYKEKKS